MHLQQPSLQQNIPIIYQQITNTKIQLPVLLSKYKQLHSTQQCLQILYYNNAQIFKPKIQTITIPDDNISNNNNITTTVANNNVALQQISANNNNHKCIIAYHKNKIISETQNFDIQFWVYQISTSLWTTYYINIGNLNKKNTSCSLLKMYVSENQIYCVVSLQTSVPPNCYYQLKVLKFIQKYSQFRIIKKSQDILISTNNISRQLNLNKQAYIYPFGKDYIFVFIINPNTCAKIGEQYPKQRTYQQQVNHHPIYVYSISSCKWHELTEQITIPALSKLTGYYLKRKLYIYGKTEIKNSEEVYQLQEVLYNQQNRPQFSCRLIPIQKTKPHLSNNCFFFSVAKKYLLFINGLNQQYWLLDFISELWVKIQNSSSITQQIQVACEDYQTNSNIFIVYKASTVKLPSLQLLAQRKYPSPESCQICYQNLRNKNQLMQPGFKLSKLLLDNMCDEIDFPFQVLGLLVDNMINFTAGYFYINYFTAPMKTKKSYQPLNNPCLYFEDDSRIVFTNQQLQQVLVNFQGPTNYNFSSVERRARTMIHRDAVKKQYGINIKLATFRLGQQGLFISINQNLQARIAYMTVQEDQCVCYYYILDIKTRKTVEGYSDEVRWYVEKKFQPLIDYSLQHITQPFPKYPTFKNMLWILSLKQIKTHVPYKPKSKPSSMQQQYTYQLQSNKLLNDICYIPSQQTYKKILNYQCPGHYSVDISLFEYLSHFFVKNQHLKIAIKVTEEFTNTKEYRFVPCYASIIDNMQKNQVANNPVRLNPMINISSLVSMQLKLCSLYANPQLNRKSNPSVFHQGVLFYYHNRLIKRYEVPLGSILFHLQQNSALINPSGFFNIFGVIQLPDSMDVNLFKNDFINHMMIEKLQRRMKFVHVWVFKNYKISNINNDNKKTSLKEGPKLRSRIVEIEDEEYVAVAEKKLKHEK